MRIQVKSTSACDSFINDLLELDEIEVRMVVTNFTLSEKDIKFKIKEYTDKYEAETNWFFSESTVRVNRLLPGKKCVQTITVSPQVDEWNKLVLYCCTDSGNYRKLCVIKRKKFNDLVIMTNKSLGKIYNVNVDIMPNLWYNYYINSCADMEKIYENPSAWEVCADFRAQFCR